jgi:carboxylesterase
MKTSAYMPGAEPFLWRGSRPLACVLTHGFTSSPAEMRWLGQSLHAQGYTVAGVCLDGHGQHYKLLRDKTSEDWLASVQAVYESLRPDYEGVVLIGHSLGGLLSLWGASQWEVAGVVALATPIFMPRLQGAYLRFYRHLRPFLYMVDTSPLPDYILQEQARRGEPALGRIRYDWWAAAAILQLYRTAELVRPQVDKIQAPVLLIDSEKDDSVSARHGDYLRAHLSANCPRVEHLRLALSGHNVQIDVEHPQVYARIAQFLESL